MSVGASVTELVNGVYTVLKCSVCNKTITVQIPIFNTDMTANVAVYQNLIQHGWMSKGDEDVLFCNDCKE